VGATLYGVKPWFQRRLEPLVGMVWRRRVSPDAVTWAGLGAAAVAGGLVLAGDAALWLVPVALVGRLAANAVDGLLARRVGATARGAVLNEVCDVLGDAVAYLPFAVVVPVAAPWAVAAVVIGLVAEVTAIAAAPAMGHRVNVGPMGKADRALAFSLVAVAVAAGAPSSAVGGALGVVALLGLATIRNRVRVVD
jgi:CDP-diacylglycerol--glycerol-3-phosphate 3-phosphatidyltransferase